MNNFDIRKLENFFSAIKNCQIDLATSPNIALPKIHKFNFLTAYNLHNINLQNYDFMHILTDGGINPDANLNQDKLSIRFNNDRMLYIDNEWYNIPISHFTHCHYNNVALIGIANADLDNGYNNLYIILTTHKLTKPIFKRNNPNWCIITNIPPQSTITYWFGILKANANWILAIPFVPWGYEEIHILWRGQSTSDLIAEWQQYYCESNSLYNAHVLNHNFCNVIECCSNRHALQITNSHLTTALEIRLNVSFVNKSDDK